MEKSKYSPFPMTLFPLLGFKRQELIPIFPMISRTFDLEILIMEEEQFESSLAIVMDRLTVFQLSKANQELKWVAN